MLIHRGTQTIETENLILRPFNKNDIPYVFKNWASDEEVVKYLTWPAHNEIKMSEIYVKSELKQYVNRDHYNWAIVLKGLNEPIGSIGAVEIDHRAEKVEIGYSLGKKWWNKGLMTEALNTVIKYFFDVVSVNRVEAKHDVENEASGKVMLKSGLQFEGRSKESDWNNRGIVDTDLYGLTKSEYKNIKKTN